MTEATLRAGDDDRDRALEELNRAFVDGRLDPETHDDRTRRALTATTLGDLAALTADLRPTQEPPAHTSPAGLVVAGSAVAAVVIGLVVLVIILLTWGDDDPDDPATATPVTESTATTPPTIVDPRTTAGFEALVDTVEAEAGTTDVQMVVGTRTFANVYLFARGTTKVVELHTYDADGFTGSGDRRPLGETGVPIDLLDVDATALGRLVETAPAVVGLPRPEDVKVIIFRIAGEATVEVHVERGDADGYVRADLDGTPREAFQQRDGERIPRDVG